MRIAYVCADPGVPVFGRKGSSVHAQGVLAALVRSGAAVEVFASRLGGEPPHDLRDLVCHELPRPAKSDPAARERLLGEANVPLVDRLGERGPFDVIYERHALFAWGAMEAAVATGASGILEVNAPLVEEQATHRTLIDRPGAEAAVRRAFSAARRIVAISTALRERLEQRPEARGKVTVIPNGVDPRRFPPRQPRPRDRPFTVAFVGTLKPWHGLDLLCDAFQRLRERVHDARLLVIGDGPGRADFERRLTTAGLDRAAWLTGAVEPRNVGLLLNGADAAVAPYPRGDHYFSPLKAVEAMAAGLPLVASRIGQLPQLIDDGRTGLLCTPGDPGALADGLASLARDPDAAAAIGAAAREHALRHHTWDGVVRRILALDARPEEVAA